MSVTRHGTHGKGGGLAELTELVREVAMLLEIVPLSPMPRGGR